MLKSQRLYDYDYAFCVIFGRHAKQKDSRSPTVRLQKHEDNLQVCSSMSPLKVTIVFANW